uniref:Uncharacterized protein n=1 Tax=Avena sativa TaxID=4498 RepID=A0ACD5UGQ4_AVESA
MEDQTEPLPHDALASILRRLPPRDLAASRCVRKTWRAVVDAHRLLLPHVLPHSVHGIFVNYIDYDRSHCLSRPSAQHKPLIDGNLLDRFMHGYTTRYNRVIDHCNGLLLYEDSTGPYVVNPATRRWDCLHCCKDYVGRAYLVFDPAVSPHYHLFFIPDVPNDPHDSMEWPPSLWTLSVFSSSTRQEERRSFVRQGEAVCTVTSVWVDPRKPESVYHGGPRRRYGVYWGGSLYVHCRGAFVARFCLSSGKYEVFKIPGDIGESKNMQYLGKSERGVSLATIYDDRLRVSHLVESDGQTDWVVNHHVDLMPLTSLAWQDLSGFNKTSWILDDGDVEGRGEEEKGVGEAQEQKGRKNNGMQMGETMEWNSDDENVVNIEDDSTIYGANIYFLGFHPYRDAILLGLSLDLAVAYHLKSSKIQYLGNLWPKDYNNGPCSGMFEAFPYTPCMIGELGKHA